MEHRGETSFRRRASALVVALVLLLVLGFVGTGCGSRGARSSESACSSRVLADWRADGRIDGLYPGRCYLGALDALPEDVRTYSSATDDITRAMQSRQEATPQARTERRLSGEEAAALAATPAANRRAVPAPIFILAAISAGLAAIAGVVIVTRQVHRAR